MAKACPHCSGPVSDPRRRYCSDSCKYRYNSLKRDREQGLPPVRKRSRAFFSMVTGSYVCSGPGSRGRGQGRRSGGTITGSMAARVLCTLEEWTPVTRENLDRHFTGIPGYIPTHARMGDDSRLTKEEVYKLLPC
jgi:hypothetical protein